MDTLAPPVVAVVVAHDPGPWFDETLASLAAQDYAELSVLVLDAAGLGEDLAARVAAVLPSAYVRRFERNRGFGATADEVQAMVDGADYYLFCHDDVALYEDAVHLLVEEAFRSNAGVVSPKVVSWDDPERLVHVGMVVDKGGSVVDRVQPNEIDHGQHDAVRDVFVAPGGCTLVRTDLFAELDGFDPAIVAMGEDLDLCWRAQVMGARIIVAPDARVRHLEVLASGTRAIEPSLIGADEGDGPRHPTTLQELQRRHELLAVFKCYGRMQLLRVVPQVFLLALGEVVVAELAGNRVRARAVARAWRWNLGRLGAIRVQRAELRAKRRLGDKEIRLLQVGGSARLSAYTRRVVQQGFAGAHAEELAASATATAAAEGFDRIPDSGSEPDDGSEAPGQVTGRVRLAVWLAAALVVVIGSRNVLTGHLPALGQFTPFPDWSQTLSGFFGGWHPSGVGTIAPAAPGLAVSGVLGTLLLGAMGLTQKVLIFGCLPVGVWGVVRLLRPFGSQRASLVAGLAYLAMPLPYDALALGRWGALVVYAGFPWVLGALLRATGLEPFAQVVTGPTGVSPSEEQGSAVASDALPEGVRRAGVATPAVMTPPTTGAWTSRHGLLGAALALGLLEALLVAFVPAAAIVVVLAALSLLVASVLLGDVLPAARAVRLALASTLVAAVICLPWVIGVLSAGSGALAVLGTQTPAAGAAAWGSLLRFAVGPIGGSPLAWGFIAAGAVPLVLARGPRFRWAVRFWSVALVSWLAAWVVGRGWTGRLAVDPLVLLVPAAVAVSAAVGLGIAAFEVDLRAADFGWRQLTTVFGAIAVSLAAFPTVVSALPGRWDLPSNDFSQSVSWMDAQVGAGAFRVLWLGDPRSLDQGGWSAGDGLAYATSENGAPDARWLWNAASPGPAGGLGQAVDEARSGRTDRLGLLLAPAGVRYVAVLTSVAPEITGQQNPTQYPVPADLLPELSRQLDLSPELSGTGITVYENAAWIPQRAAVAPTVAVGAAQPPSTASAPGTPLLPSARPVLPGPAAGRSYAGPIPAGTVLAAEAPAGRWQLTTSGGRVAPRSSAFGWVPQYRVTRATTGTLHFDGGFLPVGAGIFSVVVWLLAVAALVDRRRLRRQWERVGRARHHPVAHGRRETDLDDVWTEEVGALR